MRYLISLAKPNAVKVLDAKHPESIEQSVAALRAEKLVAIPTETVYGLAAIATSTSAINKIFTVKGRPTNHPLILHIASPPDINHWSVDLSEVAKILTTQYWPGPLTVIVKRSSKVCDEITGGRETVAIRCPEHEVAQQLLYRLGTAVVAPSANRFGKVSPTCAEHVVNDLGDDIEIVLDGGQCSIGIESTIIDCTTQPPQLLRAGAITAEQIERECGFVVADAIGESRASGMLKKHYAPNCQIELVETFAIAIERQIFHTQNGLKSDIFDLTSDLDEYARSLFARLRQADQKDVKVVIAVKPPEIGLGIAINERLGKASNTAD